MLPRSISVVYQSESQSVSDSHSDTGSGCKTQRFQQPAKVCSPSVSRPVSVAVFWLNLCPCFCLWLISNLRRVTVHAVCCMLQSGVAYVLCAVF